MNDWPARSRERFRDTWDCWKVHDTQSTADLFFDTKSGVLVGRRFTGMGYVVTEWLVEAHGVAGVRNGPPAGRDFPPLVPGDGSR
jgi:hypothetical protein